MKKTLFVGLLVVVLSVVFLFPVSAAESDAMQAVAKAGDPVIDGVCNEDAWGTPFVLSKDNSIKWDAFAEIDKSVTYRFAWSDKGLYVAVTYEKATAGDSSMLQLDCNPGGQIPANEQGLFFSIFPSQKVMIHNQKTKLADGKTTGSAEITNKVQLASKLDNGMETIEVLLPIDAFRISDENFTFSAGNMDASAVVMLHHEGAFKAGATVSSGLTDWTIGKIGLGTLTLQAKNAKTGEAGNTMVFVAIIVACALMATGAAVYSRKRKLFE